MDEIESVKLLRYQPGDIVVLRSPRRLSFEAIERLRRDWQAASVGITLADIKVIVLEEGMDVDIIREE